MSERVVAARRRMAIRLTGAALAWSAGLLVSALLLPLYNNQTVVNANGLSLTTATYVQRNGAWVLFPIALPALASLAVALAIAQRERPGARWAWLPIASVWVVGLLTILNAGGLLFPSAALLSLAAWLGLPGAKRALSRPVS